jgi:hypothetical protein
MPGIESLVQNSQKLTSAFGNWPSFHDAEVMDLHFWRGDVKSGDWDERNVFPALTVKIRILEATQPEASTLVTIFSLHCVFTTLTISRWMVSTT